MLSKKHKETNFDKFKRENRKKVNRYLGIILCLCSAFGIFIAFGSFLGYFENIPVQNGIIIALIMLGVASVNHFVLLKKNPDSYGAGIVSLIALNFLIAYMSVSHINVGLAWFLVPILTLLFCNTRLYIITLSISYITMLLAGLISLPYDYSHQQVFTTMAGYYIKINIGITVEFILVGLSGYFLSKLVVRYLERLISDNQAMYEQDMYIAKQYNILESMADIYDKVDLIDFKERTETSLREKELKALNLEPNQDHTLLAKNMSNNIVPEMQKEFWRFTDITTIQERLKDRKNVFEEVIDKNEGWLRIQFIQADAELKEKPKTIIFTVQNIDVHKRKEEHLIRVSNTDELTRLRNRRCYEDDIQKLNTIQLPDNLMLIVADVNGLKKVNDTLGHRAGDELIKACGRCIKNAVTDNGKVYRTGGDEFTAIVFTDNDQQIINAINNQLKNWKSETIGSLSMSLGWVLSNQFPDTNIIGLEKMAEDKMYQEKEKYYQKNEKYR